MRFAYYTLRAKGMHRRHRFRSVRHALGIVSALTFGLLAELPQLVELGLKQHVDRLGCLAVAYQCAQRSDQRWRVEFARQYPPKWSWRFTLHMFSAAAQIRRFCLDEDM
nr:hypothetical protein [uncultured Noviherbaspirillum sp.]